jgi:pimeloyl-ACP methyl ester carboxylesterase
MEPASKNQSTPAKAPPLATTVERVSFQSHGETIAGQLYPAAFQNGRAPAIAILGPMTYQKEHAPTLYARAFAQLGFSALSFDPRYRGESGGEPRCYESPRAKIEDLNAAVEYLAGRSEIDSQRLAVVGICMGSSQVLHVAADNPRVRVAATVTGHYRDHTADLAWLGSDALIAGRLARGEAARKKYETTGEIDYVPGVDAERMDVGMPGAYVWTYYQLWADRGGWENRYAVMSDAALIPFRSIDAAARLTKPYLMIHADLCAVPDAARRHFAVVPTPNKQLIWEGSTRHFQYYEDPEVIARATCNIVDWFSRQLGPALS